MMIIMMMMIEIVIYNCWPEIEVSNIMMMMKVMMVMMMMMIIKMIITHNC